jgi:hypothetical protein
MNKTRIMIHTHTHKDKVEIYEKIVTDRRCGVHNFRTGHENSLPSTKNKERIQYQIV